MRKRVLFTGFAAIAIVSTPIIVWAADEAAVSLDEIRSQLSANPKGDAAADAAGLGVSEFAAPVEKAPVVDEQNKDLFAQEAALLKKLKSEEPATAPAPTKEEPIPVASAKIEKQIDEVEEFQVPGEIVLQKEEAPAAAPAALAVDPVKLNSMPHGLERTEVAPPKSMEPELRQKLAKADAKIEALTRDLRKTKDRLMLAETEVDRLSKELEERNRRSLVAGKLLPQAPAQPAAPARSFSATPRTAVQPQVRPVEDVQVAVVTAEKANLRLGPGTENSPLMSVTRGTKLVVEDRRGDWYRIVTPTGSRAWVKSDVIAFNSSPEFPSSVRVRGFKGDIEALRHSSGDRVAF